MKEGFINSLMRLLMENKGFMPLQDERSSADIDKPAHLLAMNAFESYAVVELLDGDRYTSQEIITRLRENKAILNNMKEGKSHYFFVVFIFAYEPGKDKLDAIKAYQHQSISGKKFLKCLSVDLSKEEVTKYFKVPVTDLGLTNTIKGIFEGRIPAEGQNIGYVDIEDLARQMEKERQIEYKVKVPVLTYVLIGINVIISALIYLYSIMSGIGYDRLLIDFGAQVNSYILAGEYWRFVTPIFLHVNAVHLLLNCYALYAFGSLVEKISGRFKFLAVYFIAGIMGSIFSFIFLNDPSVGASGSICGLLGTLLFFGMERPLLFREYFGYDVLAAAVATLGYGFFDSKVDNYAHIGGLIGGFLIYGVMARSQKPQWYFNRPLYLILTVFIAFSGLAYGFGSRQSSVISAAAQLEELGAAEDWIAAEQKAEEILAANPDDPDLKISALWTLATAEAMSEKYDEAEEHAKMLIELSPPNGHLILGWIYLSAGQLELSREELLQAREAGADSEQIDEFLNEIENAAE